MRFFYTPGIFKKIYGRNPVWKMDAAENTIWLTFDDGPEPSVTPWVLEELEKYNAKATFFCLGKNIEAYKEIFNSIVKAGHSVGNHTYCHKNGWFTHTREYLEDVEKCNHIINSSLFRPPYGKMKPSQVLHLKKKYSIIMWSLLSGDFDENLEKEKCLDIVLKNTKAGNIIVFHDSLKAEEKLKFVLPEFLKHFHQKGFVFKALPYQR